MLNYDNKHRLCMDTVLVIVMEYEIHDMVIIMSRTCLDAFGKWVEWDGMEYMNLLLSKLKIYI